MSPASRSPQKNKRATERKLLAPPPAQGILPAPHPEHHFRSLFLSLVTSVFLAAFAGISLAYYGVSTVVVLPVMGLLLLGGFVFSYELLKHH